MSQLCILTAFNLRNGLPFKYDDNLSISANSGTEAFETGIHARDAGCIVCGEAARRALKYAYIVPKIEEETYASDVIFV
jgi:hypothetical protein